MRCGAWLPAALVLGGCAAASPSGVRGWDLRAADPAAARADADASLAALAGPSAPSEEGPEVPLEPTEPRSRPGPPLLDFGPAEEDREPEDARRAPDPPWTFSVTPYFWLFSVEGSKKGPRQSGSGSAALGDVLDFIQSSADLALMGRVEATRGAWSVFADAELLDFSGEGRTPFRGRTVDVEYDLDLTLAEVGAARNLSRFGTGAGREGGLDVLAGVRWSRSALDFAVEDAGGGSVEADSGNEWLDAFVGVRARVPVVGPIGLCVRGDAGGFGLGESSDLAWNLLASLDVAFSESFSLLAGWRRYEFEREAHDRETDVTLEGPFVALEFRF